MHSQFKIVLLLLLILMCASGALAAAKEAPTTCKKCNMKIPAENRKFSVTCTEGMESSAWDDIGCALSWRDGECAMRMSAFDNNALVYDYHTLEPIKIEQAFFVKGGGVKTLMGHDVVAFTKKEDADAFVKKQEQGKRLTYQELSELQWK